MPKLRTITTKDPNLLALAEGGRLLYGPMWQTEVARVVGVQDRSVRRWVAGERAVPGYALEKLRGELVRRRVEIGRFLRKLP